MSLIWSLSRYVLPVITVVVLVKCIMTLMLGHPKEKTYGYIIDMNVGNRYPLNMWETSVGRSNSCDIVLPYDTVARSHAVITRRIDGWYVHDLLTKANLTVNGNKVEEKVTVKDGDIITFGDHRFRFEVVDDPVAHVGKKKKHGAQPQPKKAATRGSVGSDYAGDESLCRRTKPSNSQSKPPQPQKAQRPVVTPSYSAHPDTYSVETSQRPQTPKKTRRPQPKIINRDSGDVFILCGNEVSIGSGRKCDIRLSSAEKLHALLVLYEDGWAVDAVKGKTVLSGHAVKSPQLLFDGDIISVGDDRLYFSL